MLVWSGTGLLILFVIVSVALIPQAFQDRISSDYSWVISLLTTILGGIILYVMSKTILSENVKMYIDTETGEPVTIKNRHSLFWIPAKWWPYIVLAFGLYFTGRSFMGLD